MIGDLEVPLERNGSQVVEPVKTSWWKNVVGGVSRFVSDRRVGVTLAGAGAAGLVSSTIAYHYTPEHEQANKQYAKWAMMGSSYTLGVGLQVIFGRTPSNTAPNIPPDVEMTSSPARRLSEQATPTKQYSPPESPPKEGSPPHSPKKPEPVVLSEGVAKALEKGKMDEIDIETGEVVIPRPKQKTVGEHFQVLIETVHRVRHRNLRGNIHATGTTIRATVHYIQNRQAVPLHSLFGYLIQVYPLTISCMAMTSLGMWSFNLLHKVNDKVTQAPGTKQSQETHDLGTHPKLLAQKCATSFFMLALGATGTGLTYGCTPVINALAQARLLIWARSMSILFLARPAGTAGCALLNRVTVLSIASHPQSRTTKVLKALSVISNTQLLMFVPAFFILDHPEEIFAPAIACGLIGVGLGGKDFGDANVIKHYTSSSEEVSLQEFKRFSASQKVAYVSTHHFGAFVLSGLVIQGVVVPDSWFTSIFVGMGMAGYYARKLASERVLERVDRMDQDIFLLGFLMNIFTFASPIPPELSYALGGLGLGIKQGQIHDGTRETVQI